MAHQKLSPSSSDIWMNCAGSTALIGDESSTTSQAAMLGTAAHKLVEVMIIADHHDASEYAGYAILVEAAGEEPTEIYAPDEPALSKREGWFLFMVDEKMIEGVQVTIDEVDRLRMEMQYATVFSERFLDMSWLDPRCGGTADITLVEPEEAVEPIAEIIDHKNGYIFVPVGGNQTKQYATGVLHEYPYLEGVGVTISQPNSPHIEGLIRRRFYSADELKLYEIQMKEAADATTMPNAPRRAGSWCMWCPAKTRCPEYDAMLLEEANVEFDDEPPEQLPRPTSTEELARKAKWLPVIEAWTGQIKGDIQREIENGNPVEGWKVVRGKAKRRWTNTDKMTTHFVYELGIENDDLWCEPKLKSPAQVEKLGVGKAQRKLVKAAVKEYAIMPDGALQLVPDTDPRDPATSFEDAVAEFDDDEDDFT